MSNKTSIFHKIRAQAQKISHFGTQSAHKLAREPVEKLSDNQHSGNIVEGQVYQRDAFDLSYPDVQQLFRHQFPSLTRQILGRRYNTINKLSRFVLPNGMDQAADEVLELLSEFSSQIAATEKILEKTGSKSITDLAKDVARSHRASSALTESNKIYASIQGALSGFTGLIGAAADLPLSVILSLKTIYEIGHVYGFELDNEEDERAVFQAFAQADLGLIAEKQTIFLGLRTLSSVFKSGDFNQLQQFLNSEYSVEQFKALIKDDTGEFKWPVFALVGKLNVLRFATPVVGAVVGAFYSVKLVEEVAEHADTIFSQARQYINTHQIDNVSVLEAYQLSQKQHSALAHPEVSPLLVANTSTESVSNSHLDEAQVNNESIIDTQIVEKENVIDPQLSASTTDVEDNVAQGGIQELKNEHIEQPVQNEELQNIAEQKKQVKPRAVRRKTSTTTEPKTRVKSVARKSNRTKVDATNKSKTSVPSQKAETHSVDASEQLNDDKNNKN